MSTTIKTPEELQYIGERVVEAQEKRREYNESHRAQWVSEGQMLKNCREQLHIPRSEMAELMQCSVGLIIRFENGQNVRRRPLLLGSYRTTIHYIFLLREKMLKNNFASNV